MVSMIIAHSITASTYKSTRQHGQHVQGPTGSRQHVQEHTVSWPACTRLHTICWAEKQFCFQFVRGSFDTTSGHCWMPYFSQLTVQTSPSTIRNFHSIKNNHHVHTDINRHGEAHRCSTTLSNACKTLKLSLSCYSFSDFNSETYTSNNLKKP
jgi:hypothetical protein